METPDVLFPSDDFNPDGENYTNSSISVRDLPHRIFSDDDRMPSHTYRIEATLILRQCIIACETYTCEGSIEVLDSLISAWFHRWPNENSTIPRPDGGVNQIDLSPAMQGPRVCALGRRTWHANYSHSDLTTNQLKVPILGGTLSIYMHLCILYRPRWAYQPISDKSERRLFTKL